MDEVDLKSDYSDDDYDESGIFASGCCLSLMVIYTCIRTICSPCEHWCCDQGCGRSCDRCGSILSGDD